MLRTPVLFLLVLIFHYVVAPPVQFEHVIAGEQLFLSTVRLELFNSAGGAEGIGTGFFYCPKGAEPNELLIVSNKHVLNESKVASVTISLREMGTDGHTASEVRKSFRWTLTHKRPILKHPTPYVDIAAIPFDSNDEDGGADWQLTSSSTDEKLAIVYFTDAHIRNDTQLRKTMLGISDVYMVGYPAPLWDAVNELPISRAGVTASLPWTNYSPPIEHEGFGRLPGAVPMGALDMACFPGSSGSPVVVYESMYLDREINGFVAASRGCLLGVAFGTQPKPVAGQQQAIKGIPLDPKTIPENLHITYYWKAALIRDLPWKPRKPQPANTLASAERKGDSLSEEMKVCVA